MAKIMPFNFLWCYEPEDEGDPELCGKLLLGTPETVTPLHIDIANILEDKTITLNPIDGATEATPENYHFQLTFNAGILVEPQQVSVESEHWSISSADDERLYLLWTGEELSLAPDEETEIILTGLAGESPVRTTTTDVTH